MSWWLQYCNRSITYNRFVARINFHRVGFCSILTQHSLPDWQPPQQGDRGGHLGLLPDDQVLPLHLAWRHPLDLLDGSRRRVAVLHEVWPHGGQKLGHSVKGRYGYQTLLNWIHHPECDIMRFWYLLEPIWGTAIHSILIKYISSYFTYFHQHRQVSIVQLNMVSKIQ